MSDTITPPIGGAAVLLALALAPAFAATTPSPSPAPDPGTLIERVRILSSPALAGRAAGSAEARTAADTVAAWFAAAGLSPAGPAGWFQAFDLDAAAGGGTDLNVVGLRKGAGPLAGRLVVVGAHYDHLGRLPEAGPGLPEPGEYLPGADDNASGVAVLCELARLSGAAGAAPPTGRRSVLLVAFGAEEVGLQGARAFLADPPAAPDSIDAMLNLDSVGRLGDDLLHVAGVGTSPAFADLLAEVPRDGLELSESRGGWQAGDHVAFNERRIPVLFLFTGGHADYHRPGDVWTKVSAPGLARVATYAAGLLSALRTRPGPLPYREVAEPAARPASPAGERRAWLGTIPDFRERPEGVGIAGAVPGSPAAAAGLRQGDVLLELGGRPLRDLAHLAAVLGELAPGDRVEAVVLRDGERLRLEVTLASREASGRGGG